LQVAGCRLQVAGYKSGRLCFLFPAFLPAGRQASSDF
jgi:hypothetical protein